MNINKYELTSETIVVNHKILYRIKALRSFGDVKSGDLGGYIESINNLSYEFNCWVSESAVVFDDAMIYGDARISEDARIFGNARVYDHARISGDAQISGKSYIFEKARISGNACVFGNVWVYRYTILDRGIWNRLIKVGHKYYLVSTTLEKVFVGV